MYGFQNPISGKRYLVLNHKVSGVYCPGKILNLYDRLLVLLNRKNRI